MSRTYIPTDLRRTVVSRAQGLCEYCLLRDIDTYFGCEIDHIISEKHGGGTVADNLAYACLCCNQAKGSDIGSVLPGSEEFIRFFNPRRDLWSEHFSLLDDMKFETQTPIGLVTARILGFNSLNRIQERQILHEENRYPSLKARQLMAR